MTSAVVRLPIALALIEPQQKVDTMNKRNWFPACLSILAFVLISGCGGSSSSGGGGNCDNANQSVTATVRGQVYTFTNRTTTARLRVLWCEGYGSTVCRPDDFFTILEPGESKSFRADAPGLNNVFYQACTV